MSEFKNELSPKVECPVILFKESLIPLGEFTIFSKSKFKLVNVHEAVLKRVDSFFWLLEEREALWNALGDFFWPWHPLNCFVQKLP